MTRQRICRGRCSRELVPVDHTPAPGQVRHVGRELCAACYDYARRRGTLAGYRRLTRPLADTIEDWKFLASQGVARDDAARRLGISPRTLDGAIQRWNRQQSAADAIQLATA